MKKIILPICIGVFLSSCSVTYHSVTNNSVGSIKSEAGGFTFKPNLDYTFHTAAKKKDIQKIGTTEFKVSYYGPFVKVYTKVTGE